MERILLSLYGYYFLKSFTYYYKIRSSVTPGSFSSLLTSAPPYGFCPPVSTFPTAEGLA